MEKRCIAFLLEGPPQGKGRSRSTKTGHHYTPEKTATYEARMAWTFRKEAGPNWEPIKGMVKVSLMAFFSIPKSFSRKKNLDIANDICRPIVKPDIDNIVKLLDGLNGVAWDDDSQIVELEACKKYGPNPRLLIRIEEM
jgi:Holliday junction resolvase RusA-like endonuclease